MDYSQYLNPALVPQSQPLPGQVPNSAGGHAFAVDCWTRLRRFLILGSEGGTYYADERKLTLENAKAAKECLAADGVCTVNLLTEISDGGLAPKNDPAIFVLALASADKNVTTRKAAYAVLPKICRTGTHLFQFVEARKNIAGTWPMGLRKAVARWYTERSTTSLETQLVKYRQRGGWSHRDTLRLSHPTPAATTQGEAFKFAVGKDAALAELPLISAYAAMNAPGVDEQVVLNVLQDNKLRVPWEAVPTDMLKSQKVWKALLPNMGLTALIRNLGKLTSIGLLDANRGTLGENERYLVQRLTNADDIAKSRVHPFTVLLALATYSSGQGVKGKLSWTPVMCIREALEKAFYMAFKNVEATGKNYLIGLDVSSSMGSPVLGSSLSCREAGAAMCALIKRTEPICEAVGFTSAGGGIWGGGSTGLTDLQIKSTDSVGDIVRRVSGLSFGSTDCSLPILHAMKHKLPVDVFVVITDNETWAGKIHPSEALKQYRKSSGRDAKLVVMGMASNGFSIADPSDGGMLDCVGFDANIMPIINGFVTGKL